MSAVYLIVACMIQTGQHDDAYGRHAVLSGSCNYLSSKYTIFMAH